VHELSDASALVKLYAMISRMRTLSSRETVEGADEVVCTIIKTYDRPNKSLTDLQGVVDRGEIDVLQTFSEAARQEFHRLGV
jgi:hypothetical protein